MAYIYGQRSKRRQRQRVFRLLAVCGGFVLGVATVFTLVYADKLPDSIAKFLPGHMRAGNITGPIGMGRNALATKTENNSTKKVEGAKTSKNLRLESCGALPPKHAGLASASSSLLRKLAEYEQVCNGALAGRVMFFTATPKNTIEAQSYADWVAEVLGEFADNGVSPLVILEPTISGGGVVDFKQYRSGAYDAALDAYFARLKAKGLTDASMGLWVPFPEANLPEWGSVDPGDFAANVTKTVQFQKKHFPGSKAGILLESRSYPNANSWEGGAYVSLMPFVRDIPRGLIDSFGLQGFTWPPTSEGDVPILDPKTFLRTDFAIEAANELGSPEIWFNTGTFNVSYVLGRDKPYSLSSTQRQTALNGIIDQAKAVKARGFKVAVHVFAKDKSGANEGIDWSYWNPGQLSGGSLGAFKTFVHDLNDANISLWLFDNVD